MKKRYILNVNSYIKIYDITYNEYNAILDVLDFLDIEDYTFTDLDNYPIYETIEERED